MSNDKAFYVSIPGMFFEVFYEYAEGKSESVTVWAVNEKDASDTVVIAYPFYKVLNVVNLGERQLNG